MKRIWILSTALALFATFSLTLKGEPEPFQPKWLISFQQKSGGLLNLLCLPDLEAPKVTGMAIYTDWGILRPDRYELIGSQNERTPKVSETVLNSKGVVIVEGKLKDHQGQPCGLEYRVVHQLVPDKLTMEISLVAGRNFQSMRGFLATMLNFTGATEWFARTQKGWLFAETSYDGRVFQSAHEPLDKNKPMLGVANPKTGVALVLTLKEVKPNELDNVFIHANPEGSGGIFFAWCDGITAKEMSVGDEWRISVELSFTPIGKLVEGTE